ncbi:hypothetical protein cypCar_00031612 [Cyprinus carpio]|nr:hypothetical protein cypCar_00031612 [Cyprinus carpio]
MAKDDEKKESGEWKEFFWNPRTHELLGRTASSWGECALYKALDLTAARDSGPDSLFYPGLLDKYTFLAAACFCHSPCNGDPADMDDYNSPWQDPFC